MALQTYVGHALVWLDETYSHSLNMVRSICLDLQDVLEDKIAVDDMGGDRLWDFTMEQFRTFVINSLFDTIRRRPGATQAGCDIRRDIIAMRYLRPFATTLNQKFIPLEHSIRALNSSYCQIPSLKSFRWIFSDLSFPAHRYPVEQARGVIWQRAILFRNLVWDGRWTDSAELPMEVWNIFKSLKLFTDEDLGSIFNALRVWIDRDPRDADLPSQCGAAMTFGLKLKEVFRRRPPVHKFMAFLDSRFQMGNGFKYMCRIAYNKEMVDSFLAALYAWIERNPQETRSLIHCQTLLMTISYLDLERMRRYQSFRDFEASWRRRTGPRPQSFNFCGAVALLGSVKSTAPQVDVA